MLTLTLTLLIILTLHVYILETNRLSLECRKQIDTTIIFFSRKLVFGNFDMDMDMKMDMPYKNVDSCLSHQTCSAITPFTGTRRTSECVLHVDVAGYQAHICMDKIGQTTTLPSYPSPI